MLPNSVVIDTMNTTIILGFDILKLLGQLFLTNINLTFLATRPFLSPFLESRNMSIDEFCFSYEPGARCERLGGKSTHFQNCRALKSVGWRFRIVRRIRLSPDLKALKLRKSRSGRYSRGLNVVGETRNNFLSNGSLASRNPVGFFDDPNVPTGVFFSFYKS